MEPSEAGGQPLSLVQVDAGRAGELAALCQRIYGQHYEYLWDEGGADWYRQQVYGESVLAAELRDPGLRYYFIDVAGRRAGHLRLALASELPDEPGGMELSRIYLDRDFCGQGIGGAVLREVQERGRALGRRYLWLHVMDSTEGAIRFYRANGFEVVGETLLPFALMKPGLRRMWKMRLAL